MDYRQFLMIEHDIHSWLLDLSENDGRIYGRTFDYKVHTRLMGIEIRVGCVSISVEVDSFCDQNPIIMKVAVSLEYTGAFSELGFNAYLDSHDMMIINKIHEIVTYYNSTFDAE